MDIPLLGPQKYQDVVVGHAVGVDEVADRELPEESSIAVEVVDDLVACAQEGGKDNCVVEGGDGFKHFGQLSVKVVSDFVLEQHSNNRIEVRKQTTFIVLYLYFCQIHDNF